MHANLPMELMELICNPEWKGSELLVVDMDAKPSAATLAKNFTWLFPLVQCCPDQARA